MASKRKSDDPKTNEECTPGAKKPRAVALSAGKKTKRSESTTTPVVVPVFDSNSGGETETENAMPEERRSPKPPTAEEFRAMLRDGLANVAKKDQLDLMMTQIRGNAAAIQSLERKVDSTNEANDERLKKIEERLDRDPLSAGAAVSDSRRAAFDKSRRSLRA